jgi:hypothetical protein
MLVTLGRTMHEVAQGIKDGWQEWRSEQMERE